jgi:hypothetical protein
VLWGLLQLFGLLAHHSWTWIKRHITPQGSGVATGPAKFVIEALGRLDWTWRQQEAGGRLDRLHIRVHLWRVSRWIRRLLVVTGARCPLTKPAVTVVEQQATTEPHCSRGVQPGGIYVHVLQRGPVPGVSGPGFPPGRRRFLFQLRSGPTRCGKLFGASLI